MDRRLTALAALLLMSGSALAHQALAQTAPASAPPAATAKADKPEKWNVNAPPGVATREVRISVDNGTWMNVDVSRDGKLIAFDILGDIYTMPITGGTPTRIAEGLAYDQQPRFSPDGKRIAFTSDRGGGDNIWVMNLDGGDKRQVTKEEFRLLNQPSWSPDGRFIVAKKHFTTGRSLGTGEVWVYHVSGGGGVQLVKRASEQLQKELGEPIYAADGKSVFYTRNVTPGPIFEYAQDSNTALFDIERYDLETGEVTTAVSGLGGSVRPTPSPDGKKIAFVRRERTKSKLYVKDLTSGEERKIDLLELLGDDGEALARLAGPRGDDEGVDRQHLGRPVHPGDFADLGPRHAGQPLRKIQDPFRTKTGVLFHTQRAPKETFGRIDPRAAR